MAIDLDKMRAKLAALQNRGEKKESAFWKPQDGEQTIRIVPTTTWVRTPVSFHRSVTSVLMTL